MIRLALEQGSADWLQWRAKRWTASDAAIIMGCPPDYYEVKTWEHLHEAKAGFAPEVGPFSQRAMQHGHNLEPHARAAWCNYRSAVSAEPVVIEAEEDRRFAASLDGWCEEQRVWLEIKCPYTGQRSKLHRDLSALIEAGESSPEALRKAIPPHIWWQLVHQRYCVGKAGAAVALVVHVPTAKTGKTLIVDVPGDVLDQDVPALVAAWKQWASGAPQPSSHKSAFYTRFDDAWYDLAGAWLKAASQRDEAVAAEKAAREALVESCGGLTTEGAGVRVRRMEAQGRANYRKAFETLCVDAEIEDEDVKDRLDSTRGAATVSFRVERMKPA